MCTMCRETVYILEWGGAANVPDRTGADQGAVAEIQQSLREVVAAAAGVKAFHRARPLDG